MNDSLLALFRDGAWQFAGVLVSVLSIAATFWVYHLQRSKQSLTAGPVRSQPLLSVPSQAAGRVTIQYDGTGVESVHLIEYIITNTGSRPILPADFVNPIRITPTATTTVLSAAIAAESPRGISGRLEIDATKIQLDPLLLNPGDSLTIQVLASGPNPSGEITARVAGITTLTPPERSTQISPFEVIRDLNSLLIQAFLVYSAGRYVLLTVGKNQEIPLNISISLWFAIAFMGIWPLLIKYLAPSRRERLAQRLRLNDA